MGQINLHLHNFEFTIPQHCANHKMSNSLFNNGWDRCRTPVFEQIVLLNRLIRLNYETN